MSNSTKDVVVNPRYCEWTWRSVFSRCTAFQLLKFRTLHLTVISALHSYILLLLFSKDQ